MSKSHRSHLNLLALQNPEVTDNCLLFLSSLGEISAYSLPDLKCQMKVAFDNHVAPYDYVGDLDGCCEKGGGSEERQPRWHLELRLLEHRPRPLHVHLQRVAGDQVGFFFDAQQYIV